MMVGLLPLLSQIDVEPVGGDNSARRMGSMHHDLPMREEGKEVLGEMADNLKKKMQNLRNSRGISDLDLKELAKKEFEELKQWRHKKHSAAAAAVVSHNDPVPVLPGRRPGVIVLGMHRSGTSMLSGLMVQGSGYNVGGPLIGAHFDNEKGFFERIDVVLQNDEFLKSQRMWWSSGVRGYDGDKAFKDLNDKKIKFEEGNKALSFLNSQESVPYLQKDPRMCITLKTWLKLLSHEPAVLFTYRHPLEVALSLVHREKFPLEVGLRLWIVYNMRGVENSRGLCRVTSSNDDLLANPLGEVQRIVLDLTTKCGVPEAPREITQEDVDKFIDPNLQHGKKELGAGKGTIETYNGCDIPEYDSDYQPDTPDQQRERMLYIISMKIHCDFKSGKAYEDDYEFPPLP